jgi:hypothetical protein
MSEQSHDKMKLGKGSAFVKSRPMVLPARFISSTFFVPDEIFSGQGRKKLRERTLTDFKVRSYDIACTYSRSSGTTVSARSSSARSIEGGDLRTQVWRFAARER